MEHVEVAVVGGGIAGLAAARQLVDEGHDVLVLDGAPAAGGKLRREVVAGVPVDVGAEAMLNRRPEGVDLAAGVGLAVEHPAVASSRIWTRGALRPLPRSLMGVPLDLDQLAESGVLDDAELDRVRAEPSLAPTPVGDDDLTVGDLVDAGHARRISARAAVPQLLEMARSGSLLEAGAALGATAPTTYDRPVFACVPGGMGLFAETLTAGLPVRTGATVRGLTRTADGWDLLVGPTTSPTTVRAGAVVLATPAAATARLLAGVDPEASDLLGRMEAASVAVVTLAYRVADVAALAEARSSGFLVPPTEGRAIKASTWSFAKWEWAGAAGAAEGVAHLRTSLGRHREEAALQATDADLVARSRADLAAATGLEADPVDVHVQRWGGGLPQYPLGHLARVARVRARVAEHPGLAVCGAAYDGVGIPAVIGSAHRAVARLAEGREAQ